MVTKRVTTQDSCFALKSGEVPAWLSVWSEVQMICI